MPPKAKAAPAAAAPKPKAKPEAKSKAAPKKKEEKKEDDTPKIPVVEKPDNSAFDEKIAAVSTEIDAMQKKQADITKKIGERSTGKEEFFKQKAEIQTQMDELSNKINSLQEQKDKIIKATGEKRGEARQQRDDLNKLKKSIGFTSESEIDDRIASIEFRLWTDSISLKEEKQLLAEISELKKNRPKVSMVHKKEGELANLDPGLSGKEQLAELNAQLSTLRDARRKVQDKRTELIEARNAQMGDVSEDIAKRDAISKQIQEQIKIRNELRDEKRASERKYNDYLAELRKIRQEKAIEEKKQRQDEYAMIKRKRAAEALDEQPYVSEMTLIEQTILFCKNLTASKGEEKQEETKETKVDNPEGTEVLVKKEDRDEFFFCPTTKGKKGKSKAKASGEGSKKKPIKHNAETFRLFDQLKLNAPITTDDVPPLLVELEKKLESYKEKVKEWEEKREERKKRILEGFEDEEEKKEEEAKEEPAAEEEKAEAEEKVEEEQAEAEEKAEEEEEKPEEEKAEEEEEKEEEKADD